MYHLLPKLTSPATTVEDIPFRSESLLLEFHEKKYSKKRNSVKRITESIEQNRIPVPNELALLEHVNHELMYDTPNFSSEKPFLSLFHLCNAYEHSLHRGRCTVIKGTAHGEYTTTFMVEDEENRVFTKRVMCLDSLQTIFGVTAASLLDSFSICMQMSTYLPQIYLAGVESRHLEVYSTFYE